MSEELVLNWGIIGSGLIAQDFSTALESLKSDKHRLYAVCDLRSKEDARRFAEKFQIGIYTDSLDDLLANKSINIVYIATINHTHKEYALKAIEAGKNVLCEKPMCLNSADQEIVLKAAQEKRVFFMEAIWSRFFPIIHKVKADVENKTIGELKFFLGNFMSMSKDAERIKRKEFGGGGLFDVGIYPVQMACLLFNHEKPLKITATGHLMPTGVDECCSITLLYSNQRMAQLNLSVNCAFFTPSFIVGDKGLIKIPEFSWCPDEYIRANGQRVVEPLPECPSTNYSHSAGLSYEAEQVRLAIQDGLTQHPFVTHDHSRLIFSIIEEAKKQLGYT